ncbi:AAA domain-containing protein [Dyadobacter helix]|nr:AAA domain-containing protein [Dyadobacter sp. CECT 9275]
MNTDFLLGKPAYEIIKQLVQGKTKIPLCDVQDPRYEKVNEVSKKLRKINRTEKFIEEERGSRDLYVGYPFIRGKFSDGTPVHAPLLFFPVTLKIEKEQWCLFGRDDTGIILNHSFGLAYSHFNEVVVLDDVLEKSFEDFPGDVLEFHTQLHAWLKETPFRINFNQELFDTKIVHFDAQRTADLKLQERNGEMKLCPEAVLGIFPQAGSYLVPDYEYLLEQDKEKSFSSILLGAEPDGITDSTPMRPSIREEDILTPFPMDESQEEIILEVKRGKSVVVQGPPGSGKSQLICNLMADFASRGKRVLLVCQKRAALDVVYNRLKTMEIEPFVGLIHDFKNDRPALYQQLNTQIQRVDTYRQQNYSLDAVVLERQFIKESRLVDQIVQELTAFREALFSETECGVSIKELYLNSDPDVPHIDLSDHFRLFRMDGTNDFERRLAMFLNYSGKINKEHLWHKRKNFAAFGLNELHQMERMLSDWPLAFEQQGATFQKITEAGFFKKFLSDKNETIERFSDIIGLLGDDSVYSLFRNFIIHDQQQAQRLAFIRQAADSLAGILAEEGIEWTLKKNELQEFRNILHRAIKAKQSAVSGKFWDWFSKDQGAIQKVASQNGQSVAYEDLLKLDMKVRNRMQLEEWLSNPLLAFEDSCLQKNLEIEEQYIVFFERAERAADAAMRASLRLWNPFLTQWAETVTYPLFIDHLKGLKAWLKSWKKMEEAMDPFLLPDQIDQLITDSTGYSSDLLKALRRDFDLLSEMDLLFNGMSAEEREIIVRINKLSEAENIHEVDEMIRIFENSVGLAWIVHIENKFPQLRAVTSLKMQQWEEQLQNAVVVRQQLSRDIAGMRIREFTYRDIEKNRLGNRITYRELDHQATKKRKIWPIRKLMEHYSDEIFSLIPCWLASPESVSAIFPMTKDIFDLVIFDEASQCYAEYGLPASFRGKQIVVTGDTKQLSPNDLYRVRFEEKEEPEEYFAATEVVSLLDLAAQSLAQYQLSGHYRSLSLDLIDFSNRHFYKNSLRLLPDFHRINKGEPGIVYLKTEGIWKNNTNNAEVEKVADLVQELSGSGKSIGIVTFNFYQQQRIQERLELAGASAKDLFVKNIENVQGDERDIIIFSMGYAPDEKGRLVMQFGSLNAQGGENRLNVAVTRAREKVYFVTSLWPAELKTELTTNEGPKLLKAYMQYALDVSEGKFRAEPFSLAKFRADWLLKEKLARLNPEYAQELPFGDLTIKNGEVYKGLVLTDDDLYYRSRTSKEPHAYLPLLLRQKKWPFRRFYSREYWTKSIDL